MISLNERDREDLQKLVCDLVAIESVNPDLVPSGSGEAAIAQFIGSWFRDCGIEVAVVEPVAGRPSVVGRVRGRGGGRSLMLNGHVDTVGAGAMEKPFSPEVREGRVYGRGAYDMKGSVAASMLAARKAIDLGLKGDLIVTAVADEEVASMGTAAVLESIRADAAIVTEPTELRLCVAHKGFAWFDIETHGVAAHGSRADLGTDAIAHMGPILTGLLGLGEELRRRPAHPLLGHGSIHASLIEGGQEMSTYPARCVVKVERRTIPGEDGKSALGELENLIAGRDAAVRLVLERDPSELAVDHPVSVAVAAAAERPEVIGVAYWMDMALLNAAGIPTVAYGPSGAGEHADVEWVDLASLAKCVEVYLRTAQLLCNSEVL